MSDSEIIIKGSIYIDAKLGGQEVKGLDLFEEILVIEHINQALPTASVTFTDFEKATIKELQLTDGIKLELTVCKSEDNNKEPAVFRLFSDGGSRTYSSGQQSTAHFVLDAPKYLATTPKLAKKGNSSDMMSEIASNCGLQFDGDATKDEQIWYCIGQTYSGAAKHIANHGYMTDTSCMVLGVTLKKKLLYKDINRIVKEEAKKRVYTSTKVPENDPEALLIFADRARTNSGLMNNWINYGYVYYSHGIKDKPETLKEIEVQKKEAKIAMSSEVKDEVETSRIDISHFDTGNIHEKYHRAYYQNLRYRAMFTETISIILQDFSDLELLDVVYVEIGESVSASDADMIETVKSGDYVLIGKTKVIRKGILYGERLELIRNSTRSVGVNPLVG